MKGCLYGHKVMYDRVFAEWNLWLWIYPGGVNLLLRSSMIWTSQNASDKRAI
jgi:cytochrome c-type biogenesis protein CcmH/NrfF